jgi:predicted HTH domain antitoxin
LEDCDRENRKLIVALQFQKRGIVEFWNEKVELAEIRRNAKKNEFRERGPRLSEEQRIAELETLAIVVLGTENELVVTRTSFQKGLRRQESALNRRFVKRPKVGILSASGSLAV